MEPTVYQAPMLHAWQYYAVCREIQGTIIRQNSHPLPRNRLQETNNSYDVPRVFTILWINQFLSIRFLSPLLML